VVTPLFYLLGLLNCNNNIVTGAYFEAASY
jgi:hypothetical protein